MSRCVGMADEVDSKSIVRKNVWVRVPPSAPKRRLHTQSSFYLKYQPNMTYCAKGGDDVQFKAKLNIKFYVVFVLLLGIVILGLYGLYFLNTNTILVENGLPMDNQTKLLLSALIGVAVLSWTVSLFTLVRQILLAQAFSIDKDGIHSTATAKILFALILVIPVRTIPYSAIKKVSKENGVLTLLLDKSQLDINPILRFFVSKRYCFFSGFTSVKQENIASELEKYMK